MLNNIDTLAKFNALFDLERMQFVSNTLNDWRIKKPLLTELPIWKIAFIQDNQTAQEIFSLSLLEIKNHLPQGEEFPSILSYLQYLYNAANLTIPLLIQIDYFQNKLINSTEKSISLKDITIIPIIENLLKKTPAYLEKPLTAFKNKMAKTIKVHNEEKNILNKTISMIIIEMFDHTFEKLNFYRKKTPTSDKTLKHFLCETVLLHISTLLRVLNPIPDSKEIIRSFLTNLDENIVDERKILILIGKIYEILPIMILRKENKQLTRLILNRKSKLPDINSYSLIKNTIFNKENNLLLSFIKNELSGIKNSVEILKKNLKEKIHQIRSMNRIFILLGKTLPSHLAHFLKEIKESLFLIESKDFSIEYHDDLYQLYDFINQINKKIDDINEIFLTINANSTNKPSPSLISEEKYLLEMSLDEMLREDDSLTTKTEKIEPDEIFTELISDLDSDFNDMQNLLYFSEENNSIRFPLHEEYTPEEEILVETDNTFNFVKTF